MRWIDALTGCTETAATATACFGGDHFAVTNGAVLEAALVECVAQTMAAALSQRARFKQPPSEVANQPAAGGMLAAVSSFRILSRPPAGKVLNIEVHEIKRFGPMLLVSGSVSCEGELIASGELTLYA